MAELYDEAFLAALGDGLRTVLPRWGLDPATLSLITISENATFRADGTPGPCAVRVYRPGYHSKAEMLSELAWIGAVRQAGVVETPAPVPAIDGTPLVRFAAAGADRWAAAFRFVPGLEPALSAERFATLGALSARLHDHAAAWQRPAGFTRKRWDVATTIGATPHWGFVHNARGLTPAGRAVLDQAIAALVDDLAAFCTGSDVFGLIHADLRLANLLVEGPHTTVIDFDDCGFGWHLYDFAAAVSFEETAPHMADLMAAWVAGYRTVRPLSDAHAAWLPTFVLLRRLVLTAWIASHAETPTASALGVTYTDGTVALAEAWLAQRRRG